MTYLVAILVILVACQGYLGVNVVISHARRQPLQRHALMMLVMMFASWPHMSAPKKYEITTRKVRDRQALPFSNISWIPNGSWRACEEISEFHPVHH